MAEEGCVKTLRTSSGLKHVFILRGTYGELLEGAQNYKQVLTIKSFVPLRVTGRNNFSATCEGVPERTA